MYSPSCDGGLATLFHAGLRVPALGFGGLLVGACFVLYPAFVQSEPTATKPNQVRVLCPDGGQQQKVKVIDPKGKSAFEWKCLEDIGELPRLQSIYSPTVYIGP